MLISNVYQAQVSEDKKNTTNNNSDDTSFSDEMNQSLNKEQDNDINQLVDDIKSLLRTGFTEDELKHLEKLIEEIMKKMKEDNPNIKDIKELMSLVESELAKLKEKITGIVVKKEDENTSLGNGSLEDRMKAINDTFSSLLSGEYKKKASLEDKQNFEFFKKNYILNSSSMEELQLLEELKDFK